MPSPEPFWVRQSPWLWAVPAFVLGIPLTFVGHVVAPSSSWVPTAFLLTGIVFGAVSYIRAVAIWERRNGY